MIREATSEDIPHILEMGKRFADEAGVTEQVGWDEDSVVATLTHLIDSEDGILLVGERGMIGGLIYPHPFNHSTRVFQELFWRSEGGGEGVRLFRAAAALAKGLGARVGMMIETDAFPGAARFYERQGYRPAERVFTKEL